MGHGYVQWLADKHNLRCYHFKGAAADRLVRPNRTNGSDSDVVVPPNQAKRWLELLESYGWEVATHFDTGSIFEHAATVFHPQWGTVDLHRVIPGVRLSGEAAFEVIMRDHFTIDLAGRDCAVPSVTAQRLLLLLHAARSENLGGLDYQNNWANISAWEQTQVRELAQELQAEVALAAAIGELEQFASDREYDLWKVPVMIAQQSELWKARVKAAPSFREKARQVVKIVRPNRDHIALELGHEPTKADIARITGQRLQTLTRTLFARLWAGFRPGSK